MTTKPNTTLRVTLDSGSRQEFDTGARRDNGGDKPVILVGLTPDLVAFITTLTFDREQPLNVEPSDLKDDSYGHIPEIVLNRLQALYERGAEKYGHNNYQKGIPEQRYYEAMIRHLLLAWGGDTTEDHLAGVLWNAAAVMWTEQQIEYGKLPAELGNAGAHKYRETE